LKRGKHVVNLCNRVYFYSGALLTLSLGMSGLSGPASANPDGGSVVGGSATISESGTEVRIDQQSQNALIEWQSFSIGAGETTRFVQPNTSAIAINRVVTEGQISLLNGNLLANGQVVLINPNGVVIGPSGNVDTASFLATTADLTDEEFANGNGVYEFTISGSADASIVNQGLISVADTGLAILVAPTVRNDGLIEGRIVQLAAADTFAVDLYGDGLLSFAVDKSIAGARALSVSNDGEIIVSDGGAVLMTAAAADDLVSSSINMDGVIKATSLVSEGGRVARSTFPVRPVAARRWSAATSRAREILPGPRPRF
jgi:filamentous hemagglutinin family protein